MIVGFVFGVSSVFVPVAPIAEAPGRIGAFFFAYFVGLFGMRLGQRDGCLPGWRGRRFSSRRMPSWRSGWPSLPLGNSALLLVVVGLACGMGHGTDRADPLLDAPVRRSQGAAGLGRRVPGRLLRHGHDPQQRGSGLWWREWLGYRGIFWLSAGIVAAGATTSYLLGRR